MKIEILHEQMVAAMKVKNKIRKAALSSAIDAINKATITATGRVPITEELVDTVLLKEVKTLKEMIDTCPADRKDLLNEYEQRLETIKEFAPQLITDKSGIENLVKSLGIELTKANRGAIMKELKGKVDMKLANEVLGGLLV
ncbi:MAG: GatB/YqeY domain-containing protein [Lachnospiraceae bacterium]|jgi:uncharacterized protein YqeY|nr:GatB/YqeY domain-containing protein [Lachnospiraceae bacterium]